jgi:predicted phage-related endonuclease
VINVSLNPNGSDAEVEEWLQWRQKNLTASDASKAVKGGAGRQALLQEKVTGKRKEAGAQLKELFQEGHDAEAAARPLVESYLVNEYLDEQNFSTPWGNGESFLKPLCGMASPNKPWVELVSNGTEVASRLAASFDGICRGINDETMIWEHKLMKGKTGAEYHAQVKAGRVDNPDHYWQLEHQLLVSDASRALFCVSDGTLSNMAMCWYTSSPARREALIRAWSKFIEMESSWKEPLDAGGSQEWLAIEDELSRAHQQKAASEAALAEAKDKAKHWQESNARGRAVHGASWVVSFKAGRSTPDWRRAIADEAPHIDLDEYTPQSGDSIVVEQRSQK